MADKVRFTISVDPDVHAAFSQMAEASGQSLSRVVGDWLKDTSESALFVARKLADLRRAPAAALGELSIRQRHAADEMREESIHNHLLSEDLASGKVRVVNEASARSALGTVATRIRPPSSPTGVNRKGKPAPNEAEHLFPYDHDPNPVSVRMKAEKAKRDADRAARKGGK